MFQANAEHLQTPLYSALDGLTAKGRVRLEKSWAGTFYQEVFMRLDEQPFAVLYATKDSRPNTAVNVLVSLEILKSGYGWSDEELYDHFSYDVQVRYALGYRNLGEGEFTLRTLYNFRQRLSEHMQETGENLLDAAFAQVTSKQMKALAVHSTHLRMDSTQIASNIRETSRLQLLVEVLQRVERMLEETERQDYATTLAPYVKVSAGQYIYRLGTGERPHQIAVIGGIMQRLVVELAEKYGQAVAYQVLVRVFDEHFIWTEEEQRAKTAAELSAHSLQSPDDREATFRRKQGESYRGYVGNVTETCDEDNELQLIVKVQTAPNAMDDGQLLAEAVPDLVERTEVERITTDGGYNGPGPDSVLVDHKIEHEQTAIRGGRPLEDGINLAHFTFTATDKGILTTLSCPQEQTAPVKAGKKNNRFIVHFDANVCAACPLRQLCPATRTRGNQKPVLYFTQRDLLVAQKRQRIKQSNTRFNVRAAIEATVRCLVNPLPHDKAPVRGLFRVASYLLASAFMVNLRRIHDHFVRKQQPLKKRQLNEPHPAAPSMSSSPMPALDLLFYALIGLLAPLIVLFQHLFVSSNPQQAGSRLEPRNAGSSC